MLSFSFPSDTHCTGFDLTFHLRTGHASTCSTTHCSRRASSACELGEAAAAAVLGRHVPSGDARSWARLLY